MSHPLFWLTKQFYYPIGNTSAFSLTQDLSPEQPADILLLGCGDPRSILFTTYADLMAGSDTIRKLDITCCDIEPAVLARNILLFSLLEDKEPIDRIWNIFYHFKISDHDLKLLTHHSQLLSESSQSMDSWCDSRYNNFLKMADARTLGELHRHWQHYAEFSGLPPDRLKQFHREQTDLSKSILDKYRYNSSPSRSAGMLWPQAMTPVATLFRKYWETGTTFTLASDVKSAKLLNPTFVYSLSGEVFNPHYGTFPAGFHFMPAFAPIVSDPAGPLPNTGSATINVSKQQFKAWCESFRVVRDAEAIIIRFYAGEAIAFCHALNQLATTGQTSVDIFVSPWRAPQIHLDDMITSNPPAPTSFDVIDTSNLTDHLGLLNLLIATQPLLKKTPMSQAVLYTETLLPSGEDATRSFLDRLCGDVPTIATLFGIAPRTHVSGFMTHSNVHELIATGLSKSAQFHERVAWVDPMSGDHYCVSQTPSDIGFEVDDLARALFGVYDKMFANEKVMAAMFAPPSAASLKAMGEAHFQRETAALLFRAMQARVRVQGGTWDEAIDRFLQIVESDKSRLIEPNNYQDLCLQLHIYGVHTVETLHPILHEMFRVSPRANIFKHWPSVPPVVCVVLTVPRKKLKVFFDDPEHIGSPTLQGFLRVDGLYDNTYSAIHPIWGKCATLPGSDRVVIHEDPKGMNGQSDLVISFWAQSRIVEFSGSIIALGVKSTPQTTMLFVRQLGMQLEVFRASVMDQQHVHVLPYRPTLAHEASQQLCMYSVFQLTEPSGPVFRPTVSKERACQVTSFSVRQEVQSAAEKESLVKGAQVTATQVASCTMELAIGKHRHLLSFPYPIQGGNHRLHVARKAHYVEVTAPVSKPLDRAGYFLNPFPIIRKNAYTPWNVHHIHLERLPVLDTRTSKKVDWLNAHTALQMSEREKAIRNGSDAEKEAAAHAIVNVKDSIHAIIMNVSGLQGRRTRTLGLSEPGNGGVYMILLVGGIRLDLASATVVVDTAVVPLSNERMPHLVTGIQKLQSSGTLVQIITKGHEVAAWKKLLPAYVERCRTWGHKPNCEYLSAKTIPISIELDQNPICTCGNGVGLDKPEWREWKDLLPFATRAAISPLFSVSYTESVVGSLASGEYKARTTCWKCGGPGKPNLSACSRCKVARYCSVTCQRQDWKEHKKDCEAV